MTRIGRAVRRCESSPDDDGPTDVRLVRVGAAVPPPGQPPPRSPPAPAFFSNFSLVCVCVMVCACVACVHHGAAAAPACPPRASGPAPLPAVHRPADHHRETTSTGREERRGGKATRDRAWRRTARAAGEPYGSVGVRARSAPRPTGADRAVYIRDEGGETVSRQSVVSRRPFGPVRRIARPSGPRPSDDPTRRGRRDDRAPRPRPTDDGPARPEPRPQRRPPLGFRCRALPARALVVTRGCDAVFAGHRAAATSTAAAAAAAAVSGRHELRRRRRNILFANVLFSDVTCDSCGVIRINVSQR